MTSTTAIDAPDGATIGIAEMASRCGLSPDTLRWYEKEGLLPRVSRTSDGRRAYSPAEQRTVHLLTRLRAPGMPTADMRSFVALLAEGSSSHARRVTLLRRTGDILAERRRAIEEAQQALAAKIAHDEQLISAGLDFEGEPLPQTAASRKDPS